MKITEKQLIVLQPEIIEKANEFADAVTSTTNYSDSNQHIAKKIRDDHFISKLGEEAVKILLQQNGCEVTGPDYQIYKGRNKSWSSDLYIDSLGIAVKTQRRSAAKRYGLSWTFQAGHIRRDRILAKPEAWVFFVEYIDTKHSPNELIVYPPKQIKDLVFEDPVLPYLRGEKLVVYKKANFVE